MKNGGVNSGCARAQRQGHKITHGHFIDVRGISCGILFAVVKIVSQQAARGIDDRVVLRTAHQLADILKLGDPVFRSQRARVNRSDVPNTVYVLALDHV